jgi:topoisomerase-4 subunit B
MTSPSAVRPAPVCVETATLVRALVLYALAEAQAGFATRIEVTANGGAFTVADNGRGHSIDKRIDGTPYLSFIYEHLAFPFDRSAPGAVQLQGIGMSLINQLSDELRVRVQRADEQLELTFINGSMASSSRSAANVPGTGTAVGGKASRPTEATPDISESLRAWLSQVAAAVPGLQVTYNGQSVAANT